MFEARTESDQARERVKSLLMAITNANQHMEQAGSFQARLGWAQELERVQRRLGEHVAEHAVELFGTEMPSPAMATARPEIEL